MTRLELLQLLVGRARANGFEFRRWYVARLDVPWISSEAALALLNGQRRYYALIFSHEFAQAFWNAGGEITFDVPRSTFQRAMPDGSTRTVQRKGYIRRSVRPNAWRYHLREMAGAEEPLRYLRRYLHVEEELAPGEDGLVLKENTPACTTKSKPGSRTKKLDGKRQKAGAAANMAEEDLPAFLRQPVPLGLRAGKPADNTITRITARRG